MSKRNIALAGAALLVIGLFLPIVTLPIIGTVNLFNGGTNWLALALLALGAIAAGLALRDRTGDAIFPGTAAAAILIYKFVSLQWTISEMRASLTENLKDNPFAGIAQAALSGVQLQWGWLVLGAGAAAMVYAAVIARREDEQSVFSLSDGIAKAVAGVSLLLALLFPGLELYRASGTSTPEAGAAGTADLPEAPTTASDPAEAKLAQEKADYIATKLSLYDLRSRYYDSVLDGNIPGVEFKLKNNGNRTLKEVKVLVEFRDEAGKAIAEESYYPVLVTDSGFGDSNKPLRPNYIWQQESGRFYSAKSVPSEWKAGNATAKIVEIEFMEPEKVK